MSRELEILPDVRYRIQNVDLETFLERRGDSVILRQLKNSEVDRNQEWVFIKRNTNSSAYEIRNLDDSDSWSLDNTQAGFETTEHTGAVQDPLQVIDSSSSSEKYWKFILKSPETSNDFYIMSDALKNVFAYVTLNSAPALKFQSISSIKPGTIFLSENYQWRLAEVTPASLPDGAPEPDGSMKYRIRTLNGKAFHSVAGKKTLSIADERAGDQREFIIVSKGNGKCTIYNVKEQKFLSATKINDKWTPTLETVVRVWDLRKNSDFTYSICVDLEISKNKFGVITHDTFSLTLKDLTIVLKPMKFAHNQFWLIEAADAPPPDVLESEAEIIPGSGLKPGQYELHIPGNKSTIAVRINGANVEVFDGKVRDVNSFRISPNPSGHSGDVFISYEEDDEVLAYLAPNGSEVAGQKGSYSWTIEKDQASGNYYIKDGKNVLSAPESGNKFVIKSKSNTTTDLWQFK